MNLAEAQHGNMQLIEIRKVKSDFGSLNDYQIFRDEQMNRCIHPWFKQAYQHIETSNIPNAIWGLIGCEKIDGVMTNSVLLAFEELDFEIATELGSSFENITGFHEWVTQFNPTSWGDWLMVPKLYLMYLRTRKNLPTLEATPDPWIDAVLRESRGMLMWSYQFIEIARMIADVSITEANQLRSNWVMMKPDIKDILVNIYYLPTKQTLLQIFEERMEGMKCLGSPDYFFADWLVRYYYSAKNSVCDDEAR